MEQQTDELRRERQSLLTEQGAQTDAALSQLREYFHRAGAWLSKL